MRKSILTLCLLLFPILVMAQNELSTFNESRLSKQKTAMLVLGSWAIGNMAAGAIGHFRSKGSTQYFHQMNAGWNAVNLAIAGFGYYSASKVIPLALGLAESIDEFHKLQGFLLLNAGLDVGYMLGGAYLMERAKNTSSEKNTDRLRGFGTSILMQGGFLFLFDISTYFWLNTEKMKITPLISGNAMGAVFTF